VHRIHHHFLRQEGGHIHHETVPTPLSTLVRKVVQMKSPAMVTVGTRQITQKYGFSSFQLRSLPSQHKVCTCSYCLQFYGDLKLHKNILQLKVRFRKSPQSS
jgi:hypothetical protein